MKPRQLATPEAIHVAYQDGESAVLALFEAQTKIIEELEARLQALENQVAKNSRNSNKPPSSDGLNKPAPKSWREKSGKPSGGQKGHRGYRLEPVEEAHHIERRCVVQCRHCQANLTGVEVDRVEKRQEFDIPEVRLVITEYQGEVKSCPVCGQVNAAAFPEDVRQPTQYGPHLRAQMVYLNAYQCIPLARTAEIIGEFYQQPISDGTVAAAVAAAARAVAPVNAQVKAYLTQTDTPVHFDETGARVNGRLAWVHSASTEQATYYAIHPKRGSEAINSIGILPEREGWSIHDAWVPYFSYTQVKHALCNAHLVRELVFLIEQHAQVWAKEFLDLLLEIKRHVEATKDWGQPALPNQALSFYEQRYDRIVEDGLRHNPAPTRLPNQQGRLKQSPARNLLDRLGKYKAQVLAFAFDFAVPFDNNLAERDIRMVKVQQKVSGGFRSADGANAFCQLRSYISTARKNGHAVLSALFRAFVGKPYLPYFMRPIAPD